MDWFTSPDALPPALKMEGKSASADAFRLVANCSSRHTSNGYADTPEPIGPTQGMVARRRAVSSPRTWHHAYPQRTDRGSRFLGARKRASHPESADHHVQRMDAQMQGQIRELDVEINRRSKTDPVAGRLMTIPGVGPIAATAITALVPAAENFGTGRNFAAWLGLTPLQKSTSGKQKLGAISKQESELSAVCLSWEPVPWSSRQVCAEHRQHRGLHRCCLLSRDAGNPGFGQREGPCRVGSPGQRRRLQGSGRGRVSQPGPRGRRATRRRVWRNSRRDGIGKTRVPHCASSTPKVIWNRSANSHTAPRRDMAESEAGQMAAPTTGHHNPEVFPSPEGGVL